MTPEEMLRLGIERNKQGDLSEAERLFSAAAEAGNVEAMNWCGVLLGKRDDSAGAEEWYRKAAATGDVLGAYNVAYTLGQRGDHAEAEEWYRKAADGGDEDAVWGLARTLSDLGRPDEAEGLYHRAARSGNVPAMNRYGRSMERQGDAERAEHWYRKAADEGNVDAMFNLGLLLRKGGDAAKAAQWFQKAADTGDEQARTELARTREALEQRSAPSAPAAPAGSAPVITFDTSGFESHEKGRWFDPQTRDAVVLNVRDALPPTPVWLEDLDTLRRELARAHAATGDGRGSRSPRLVEADIVSLDGVRTLYSLVAEPLPSSPTGRLFRASFVLAKASRTVILRGQFEEWDISGIRETTVLIRRGIATGRTPHPYAPELPYEPSDAPEWDSLIPSHPLTKAREWVRSVIASAVVDRDFAALDDFRAA
ncbi:hypothetical protein GCM10029978_099060 [Actinoallomurus acanthiterrae]